MATPIIVDSIPFANLCGKERRRAYSRAYGHLWRAANFERIAAWKAANHEHLLEQAKEYRETHKEQVMVSQHNCYLKNRMHYVDLHAKWKAENPEKRRDINRRYYQAHRLEINKKANEKAKLTAYAQQKEWALNHKEWRREKCHRRRAQKLAVTIERVDYKAIMLRDKMVCGICHKLVALKDLHLDHRIPLARGGPHVEWNIQVAHWRCNLVKHTKVIPVQLPLGVSL